MRTQRYPGKDRDTEKARETYYWTIEVVGTLLELLQSILGGIGTRDNGADLVLSHVFEDCLKLIRGRSILGDVQVELRALGVGLVCVIAGLVLCGGLCGIGRNLLQESGDPQRSWGARLVEDGDDVLCFALRSTKSLVSF